MPMDKIVLYSTHCPKCTVLEIKLKQLHLDFDVVEDKDTVVTVGKEHNINTAPILQVNDKYYDFTSAINYLKSYN